jgi:hypothetical protein
MRRVPALGDGVPPLFCASLSQAKATTLTVINVVSREDDSFCIFPALGIRAAQFTPPRSPQAPWLHIP